MLVSEMVFWFLLTENVMPLSVPLPRITRHGDVNASKYIERWKSIRDRSLFSGGGGEGYKNEEKSRPRSCGPPFWEF